MSTEKKGNWGLRLLALVLAIVIYNVLKNEPPKNHNNHARIIQQHR